MDQPAQQVGGREASVREASVRDCAALLVAAGAPAPAADRTAAALVARYREPQRRYHTLEHIAVVLAAVDDLVAAGEPVVDLTALRIAAWYHDAIVTLDGAGDEERSADLATADLTRLAVDPATTARVAALVRVTATHRPDPSGPGGSDARLLIDADLSVLGGEPAAYAAYAAAVRAEYAAVGDADFRRGRAAVLRRLLDRPSLFWTATMRRSAEARARANLRDEIALLERGTAAPPSAPRPTPFTAAVRAIVAATVPGEVVTYGDVAAEAGHPGAARAVGTVLRRSEGLPWWRVVAASGRLASGKDHEQARRLRAEGVVVREGRVRPER